MFASDKDPKEHCDRVITNGAVIVDGCSSSWLHGEPDVYVQTKLQSDSTQAHSVSGRLVGNSSLSGWMSHGTTLTFFGRPSLVLWSIP